MPGDAGCNDCPKICGDCIKNGAETDVDCGGTCHPCGPGMACLAGEDCTNGACVAGKCH